MRQAPSWNSATSVLFCLLSACLSAAVVPELSLEAARKFERIAGSGYPSGTAVTISQDEINSYLRFDGAARVPEGISDLEVEFREGGAIVSASVDLEKASSATEGLPVLMRLLIRGERAVVVDVDYSVEDGTAAARLVSVTIDDARFEGAVLSAVIAALAPVELSPYFEGDKTVRQQGVREARLEPGKAVFLVE